MLTKAKFMLILPLSAFDDTITISIQTASMNVRIIGGRRRLIGLFSDVANYDTQVIKRVSLMLRHSIALFNDEKTIDNEFTVTTGYSRQRLYEYLGRFAGVGNWLGISVTSASAIFCSRRNTSQVSPEMA